MEEEEEEERWCMQSEWIVVGSFGVEGDDLILSVRVRRMEAAIIQPVPIL